MRTEFIDREAGAVVAPCKLDLLRPYRTASEKGSRRFPFKITSLETAIDRARVCQAEFCVELPPQSGRVEVFRVDKNGGTVFLYTRKV